MEKLPTLDLLKARDKRILVRLDLNLPLHEGRITDLTRLKRSLPTIQELVAEGAKVIILTHLGRPKGEDPRFSLSPIAQALEAALAPTSVFFCASLRNDDILGAIQNLQQGQVLLLENMRFFSEEETNDPYFVQKMARWGEAYVNDAFSTAHRAHASTEGVAHHLPRYAGRLMEEELKTLHRTLETPERPLMAVVGGSKISTKLPLLENLLSKVDVLVMGGAMANTLLAAQGYSIGASLYEPGFLEAGRALLEKYPHILLPKDVVVAKDLEDKGSVRVRTPQNIEENEKIFDIGPETCESIFQAMSKCRTVLWNGPLGVFEVPPFDQGTVRVARGIADLTQAGTLVSIAGGGDTVSALSHAHVLGDLTYVSTAGGAFLEWLEGKPLPGVRALLS